MPVWTPAANFSFFVLFGTPGSDTMNGTNNSHDTFMGSAGADRMNGYKGIDTADYSESAKGVIVDLNSGGRDGDAEGDTYFSIENVIGSERSDKIYGSNAANRLEGLGGADVIFGLDGTDTIYGNDGNDELSGGSENDYLYGGGDNDVLSGDQGADWLYGGTGDDTLFADISDRAVDGSGGKDTLIVVGEEQVTITLNENGSGTATSANGTMSFTGIENVTGWDLSSETINGNSQGNVLNGKFGNDTLNGGGGNDTLIGGFSGAPSASRPDLDTLNGGRGNDTMTGGKDRDTFVLDLSNEDQDNDVITDFEVGLDKIDLSGTEEFGGEDFDEVLDDADQVGNDVVIDMGVGTLTLKNIDIDDLSAGDFIF